MNWDGIRRRSDDSGKESPDVVLARIDEKIKGIDGKLDDIKTDATEVRVKLEAHEKDDDKKFAILNRTIYLAVGGGCVVVFIINWFHH